MEKIKVRRQERRRIYVHNDLSNAAYYFKKRTEQKLAEDNRTGIAFDFLAGLVMLAFAFEAKTNFLGDKLIVGWKERQPFRDKVDTLLAHLDVRPDWNRRRRVGACGCGRRWKRSTRRAPSTESLSLRTIWQHHSGLVAGCSGSAPKTGTTTEGA